MSQPANTAARRIVDTLVMNGIDRVFCVPGESYLAVLDALADVRDTIQVIACRHEAGAANMAEAYGKLTGKPGVCMVTRGPGATHAAIGVHTAHQDSTPMILFVGQIALTDRGRGAFQEVDYREVFGGLAKWATEIESPERTVEVVERAFATALQGRMGPVVIALPEDILHADGGPAPIRPVTPAKAALDPAFVEQVRARLSKAERPLLVLGGSGWTEAATTAIGDWAERIGLPVALSFRRKDLISNDRPNYAGDLGLGPNPKLVQRVKDADLILTIGARLGENPTQGYTLFDRSEIGERLIHIHPGPEELGRVWPTLMGATADNSLADPPGDVVMNRYYLDTLTLQLMCVGNGNPDAPIRIASNVEQFQVQYALPQMNPGGAESVSRYVTADAVDALGSAAWGTTDGAT
jgi:acetolactate synthase-1/2/3 large subunit